LESLLRRVGTRRRVRKWRTITAAAAAAVIAVGGGLAGGAAISQALSSGGPAASHPAPSAGGITPAGYESFSNTDPGSHVTAIVDYRPAKWGTSLRVWVGGVKTGTTCEFWVVDNQGHRWLAGGWIERTGDQATWYPVSSPVSSSRIHHFEVSAGSHVMVSVPAI
jgi:hypothetical protein